MDETTNFLQQAEEKCPDLKRYTDHWAAKDFLATFHQDLSYEVKFTVTPKISCFVKKKQLDFVFKADVLYRNSHARRVKQQLKHVRIITPSRLSLWEIILISSQIIRHIMLRLRPPREYNLSNLVKFPLYLCNR
jgi:hypothetical protein